MIELGYLAQRFKQVVLLRILCFAVSFLFAVGAWADNVPEYQEPSPITPNAAWDYYQKVMAGTFDTDGDGLSDDWERMFFGNLYRDGSGDMDEDGTTDLKEYKQETDPTDPDSK